jgi:chitinase
MIWDMSQVFANSGFINVVTQYLDAPGGPTTMTTSTTSATTTTSSTGGVSTTPTQTTTSPTSTNTGLVNQWNQCGGQGWNGGTVCVAPYKCVVLSVWYSMCE